MAGKLSYHQGLTVSEIAQVGAEIGLLKLSLSGVAARLNVTTPALYRHVKGREELVELVVTEYLSQVDLSDRCQDARTYLLHCARQLFVICAEHPGLSEYFQLHFPNHPELARLERQMDGNLAAHGLEPMRAKLIASLITTIALSLVQADQITRQLNNSESDVVVEVAPNFGLTGLERFTLMMEPVTDGVLSQFDTDQDLVQQVKQRLNNLPSFPATSLTPTAARW